MDTVLLAICVFFCFSSIFLLILFLKNRKQGGDFVRLNDQLTGTQTENALLRQQLEQERISLKRHEEEQLQHQANLFETEKENLEKSYRAEVMARENEIRVIREQYEERLSSRKTLSDSEIAALKSAFETEKKALLQTNEDIKAQFGRSMEEMEKNHQTKLSLMKEEFKNLSEIILQEKSGKLHEANKQQLEALLNPLSEKMGEFRKAVDDSRAKGVELNAALTAQLGKMMEETSRIGGEARELVNALKGQQKTQGDWGEMILEEILQRSGLQEGRHYERQFVIRDASGKTIRNEESEQTMRPDIVVHYPDGKDVIIDSKVSLTAYVEYMNAEDENLRTDACRRHIRSVKSHVDELVRKNYAAYLAKSGRETVDFVIMFIPHEGSFQLAMISDPGLWNEAFHQKVLIVSPVNLMALLKIIHISWSRDEQNRNQQAILDTASELLDRLYSFYAEFDNVGDAIASLSKKYDEAARKLKQEDHNRSVVLSGEKLKKLGISMKKSKNLPERFQTMLELDGGETETQLAPDISSDTKDLL